MGSCLVSKLLCKFLVVKYVLILQWDPYFLSNSKFEVVKGFFGHPIISDIKLIR